MIEESQFGDKVARFLNTEIGRYIGRKAEDEVEYWMQALKSVDPVEANEVRKCQTNIYRAEQVLVWLGEAVTAGDNAKNQLQIMEAAD